MSLGNGNPKDGDKGSNFNYELKVLQGLDAIAVALENPPTKTFTNTAGTTTGAGILISNSLLIPANTITNPSAIEFIAKFYRVSGTTNTISSYLFTNTTNSIVGASLLATGGAIATGAQMGTLARTMNYVGGVIKTLSAASLFASDYTTQPISSVTFNPAVDNYFMFVNAVSAGDTAVCQSYRVTIY
jgi:type IV secretory pathway VirB2 component (pilin)